MLHLIPAVKKLTTENTCFTKQGICYESDGLDLRLLAALKKLPYDPAGAMLTLSIGDGAEERYTLSIREDAVHITAPGPAGAFYAIQTLRQIFTHSQIPCLTIEDAPDFPYRGFYHDVTRGKIPTVETIKQLIDQMAYYKLNSLQLYVEHSFAFKEYAQLNPIYGCLTQEDLLEIGAYCRENFIEFIPSLSSFGHLYELLEQPQYRHLRVLTDLPTAPNFWYSRMLHHTINPEKPESIDVIKSLIDQYAPCFESDWFNICCDETADLQDYDVVDIRSGALYVEFVNKIISHLKEKGKKVMMWADILLDYPHTITDLPEDTCFLNWSYRPDPPEEKVIKFAQLGRKQILCPGTSTWSRLCENIDIAEPNICRMAEYGKKHGAIGLLNTNWGDYGNPCSLELAMYGLVLGAEKAWSVDTAVDDTFYGHVNALLYAQEDGFQLLTELNRLHNTVNWNRFCKAYFYHRYHNEEDNVDGAPDIAAAQAGYIQLAKKLQSSTWIHDEYRQEMLLAAEGVCVIAELWEKLLGHPVNRLTDTRQWLSKYAEKWHQKNKPSELYRILEVFEYCEDI